MKVGRILTALVSFFMVASVCFAAKPDGGVEYLSKTTFAKKVYDITDKENHKFMGDKPVILDYTATWCPPCKKLSPVYEELAKEYKGRVDFYKIDVDENRELMGIFGVNSMPTLIYISKDGKKYTKSIGFNGKESIVEHIEEILKK